MDIFIALLVEEDYNRNRMKIIRKQLRDTTNPFEIPETQFKQMFRLNKISVQELVASMENYINRDCIPIHIKVLATLNFLTTGTFQRPVGNNHFILLSQPLLSRIITEVCQVMTNHLLPQWIKFPTTMEQKNEVKQGFYERWGVRGVIGVIDATHVDILASPITDLQHPPFVYINRKGKHSINVMLVCQTYPGSVHDSAIWQMSNIKAQLERTFQRGDTTSHLLGDSGYPLEPWLFTPYYQVQHDSPEARFNRRLQSVRNTIERCNGMLKGRFRCLSRHQTLIYHPIKAANIIYSCCILRNIAITANLPILENEIEQRENEDDQVYVFPLNGDNNNLEQGGRIRQEYVNNNYLQ